MLFKDYNYLVAFVIIYIEYYNKGIFIVSACALFSKSMAVWKMLTKCANKRSRINLFKSFPLSFLTIITLAQNPGNKISVDTAASSSTKELAVDIGLLMLTAFATVGRFG